MIAFIQKKFYTVIVRMWKKRMKDSTAFYLFVLFCCLLATVIYFYYKPYELIDAKSPNGEMTASLFLKQTELGQYPTVFLEVVYNEAGESSIQPLGHPSIHIWFGRNNIEYDIEWESNERFTVTNLKDTNMVWSVGVKPLLSVTPVSPEN